MPLALLTSLLFFPGFLAHDSLRQLDEARLGVYSDQHPPFLAVIWRYVDHVVPGPFGMLLLQNLLYWTGFSLTAVAAFGKNRLAAAFFLAIGGVFPPYFALQAVVWKDAWMNSSLMLAVGLLTVLAQKRERDSLVDRAGGTVVTSGIMLAGASAAAILFASTMRHNAFAAAFPLLWLLTYLLGRNYDFSPRSASKALLLAIPTLLAIIGLQVTATRALTDRPSHFSQLLPAYDLVGISVLSQELVLDVERYPALGEVFPAPVRELGMLKQRYDPCDAFRVFSTHTWGEAIYLRSDRPEVTASLWRAWRDALREHPDAYVAHRLKVFSCSLGLGSMGPWYTPYLFHTRLSLETRPRGVFWDGRSELQDWVVTHVLAPLSQTVLYKPLVYFLAVIAIAAVCTIRRGPLNTVAFFVALSGALNQIPYLIIGVSTEFRYYSWTILSGVVALLLFSLSGLGNAKASQGH